MKKIITEFNQTGACEINLELVKQQWNNQFTILVYDEKFTLVKYRKNSKGSVNLKVEISKEQALELVDALQLKCITDTLFKKAKSYKTSDFIFKEIVRLNKIHEEKEMECTVIKDIIKSYFNAV